MSETDSRTVLFLCECGPNIADSVDLGALEAWAAERPDVVRVERHALLCSPDGKAAYAEALAAGDGDRIVVAACSPKMHEKTFQDLAETQGINQSRVQMANIREHCAWVTRDPGEAVTKAKSLISAALRRAALAEHLEARSMEALTDLLIIGGGLAGMEAALTAAHAGRQVTLVEQDISLGGAVIQTEEVAPSMECAPCLLAPRLAEIKDHPKITVLSNAEVTDVLGFYGNFTVKVHERPRYVKDNCIGCEACFEVCPVEMTSPFHLGLGTWKAVHNQFPGSVPAAAVIDREHCKHFTDGSCDACVAACPFQSIDFEQEARTHEIDVGAIVVATGLVGGDVSAHPELGYGTPNVLTLPEFERLASSNGPTGGQLTLANGQPPTSVAVVHCAGSLREDGLPYCSGTCCTDGVKVGALVRHQLPEAQVTNLHHDLVFTNPAAHRFYRATKDQGTNFVVCDDLRSVQVTRHDGGLRVTANGVEPLDVDLVVLANGVRPPPGTDALAGMLNVEQTPEGFFAAGHDLLQATSSTLDGVYLAGGAGGPCDVATAVTRGQAAVGDALSKLQPGRKIELEMMTSVIDEEVCAGCKLCLTSCPYKAIIYDGEAEVCRINEAICRGCGTCSAGCPSGASRARHYTDEQLYAEIGGLING